MMSAVDLLRQVGAFPLDATLEDVKELAETIWYQGYMPSDTELDQVRGHLSREGFQRLLCVLELLNHYRPHITNPTPPRVRLEPTLNN